MLDQAQNLRNLFNNSTVDKGEFNNFKNAKVITITSGKGGVGKSNISVNLSLALQSLGKKVMILDADIGMGNDDVLMGVVAKNSIFDIINKNLEIEDVLVECPLGVKLIPGGSGILRVEDLNEVEKTVFLRKLEVVDGYDYIIIDTGAGINKSVLSFIACCEELMVVMTSEPTAMTDAYSLLKAVNHFKIKRNASVIINKVEDFKEGDQTYRRFNSVVQNFLDMEVKLLGIVREDFSVSSSVKSQKPFILKYPDSMVAKDIKKIAHSIEGYTTSTKVSGLKDVFGKLFKLFK